MFLATVKYSVFIYVGSIFSIILDSILINCLETFKAPVNKITAQTTLLCGLCLQSCDKYGQCIKVSNFIPDASILTAQS